MLGVRKQRVIAVFAWIAYGFLVIRLFFQALSILTVHGDASDLHIYIVAAHTVFTHNSIYDYTNPVGDPFTYPPFAAYVLIPTVAEAEYVVDILWIASLILGTAFLAILLAPYAARWFGVSDAAHGRSFFSYSFPSTMILVTASGASTSNLINGQISLFIILLVIIDCVRLLPSRYGGVATGIAAAIKLTPLIFIPYFWIIGRRRAAVTASITFVTCTALSYIVRPYDSRIFWFTDLWNFGRVADAATPGNQSIRGMLARFSMTGHALTWTWLVLAFIITGIGLWRASRAAYAGHAFLGAAIVGAASVCVSPVSWEHHCIWLLAAAIGTPIAGARLRLVWPAVVAITMIWLLPYALIEYVQALLPIPLLALAVSAQGLLAIAVACFVPFHEVRRGNGGLLIVNEQAQPDTEVMSQRLGPLTEG